MSYLHTADCETLRKVGVPSSLPPFCHYLVSLKSLSSLFLVSHDVVDSVNVRIMYSWTVFGNLLVNDCTAH